MSQRIRQVLAVLFIVMNAPEATAACNPDPPMDNDSVVCDGTDSTGYDGSGATGLTITGKEDNGGIEIDTGFSFTPENANRLQFDLRYEAFVSSHTVEQNLVGRVQLGF